MSVRTFHYLLRHVIVGSKDECWNWTGPRDRDGYGMICFERAHRVMYVLSHRIPVLSRSLVIRHKCDNPGCCNPKHLERGTQLDNVTDRVARNRSAKGERNGRAKLTEDQVLQIRASKESQVVTGRKFGIDKTTVRDIRKGKIWGGIPGSNR